MKHEEKGVESEPECLSTLRELISKSASLPAPDADFAEDLAAIQADPPPRGRDPWES